MKKKLIALGAGLALLGMSGLAHAALTTIGTATYMGQDCKLIWDDDNNGSSVIWLDYSKPSADWSSQMAWAAGLDPELTYKIDARYSVAWDEDAWRLPTTVDGAYELGSDGNTTAGFNITSSEMGHLYYEELGNLGYKDTLGNKQSGYGLYSTGDFDNLIASWYWSGTECASDTDGAWYFDMYTGGQDGYYKSGSVYGLALRNGQVSAVPVPGAAWLLGSGLAGLAALGRCRKGNRG